MAKLRYIGPERPTGTVLDAYGRGVTPDLWTEEQQQEWFRIEPRYKVFFDQDEKKDDVKVKESK
jgi:hypothetical protein